MSALPDEPDHFQRWADANAGDFLPRHHFASYLRDTLESVVQTVTDVHVVHHRQVVVNITPTTPVTVHLADGSQRVHDRVVIATGNAAPVRPEWLPNSDRIIADPWQPGALAAVPDGARVACVGTGLTFVDVALTLVRRGVHVRGLSRHGLLPATHATVGSAPTLPDTVRTPLQIMRWIRSHNDWRAALTAMRPHTQRLWQLMAEDERRRFVRLPMRYWEVHRHRMAPDVAADLRDHVRDGTIAVSAFRAASATTHDDGRIALVDTTGASTELFDHVVVCTGPSDDVRRSTGLLGRLIESGVATAGPLGFGIDTDPVTGALRDSSGSTCAYVYCIGTMRRGTLWETTAIPELRVYAHDLAKELVEPLS
jgi:uncharacterized NAD(P)/FAD-binding protein YdhS